MYEDIEYTVKIILEFTLASGRKARVEFYEENPKAAELYIDDFKVNLDGYSISCGGLTKYIPETIQDMEETEVLDYFIQNS